MNAIPRPTPDAALTQVTEFLMGLDPTGARMARVFRQTFDQLYDGQHTGRYRLDQLFKTEKTHFGTLIEINLQRELRLDDGHTLDFSIAGHEVDCKYSHTGQWMLPQESFEHLALVTQANDEHSTWSAGLVRVSAENRRTSENRDRKTGLNALGRARIQWLHKDAPMTPNALLSLPQGVVERVMSGGSGQARINELLRLATGVRLSRTIIATVAQQEDYMKRVRSNGGARSALGPQGFLILGGDYVNQREVARSLGTAVPEPGEVVSVRVVPDNQGVLIGDERWRAARPNDAVVVPAPTIGRG